MKRLLFHACPSDDPASWNDFLRKVSLWEPPEDAERLAPNVWVIPDGLAVLQLGRICYENSIVSRCLPIRYKAEWQNLPK